ncbi:PIN domain-containing protein [Patescibacteria group bacterium AH-259-L07]|nr:PIN domain-containing protein [Patescibacteria group bacterium AH-259-L07]
MFLVDTNVLIRAVAGISPDAPFLKKAIENNAVSFPVVTIAEFLTKASTKEKKILDKLVRAFPVYSIDEKTARLAALYRKQSLKRSRVKLLDCFIAAQANLNKIILVTNNRSDFPMKDIKVMLPKSQY